MRDTVGLFLPSQWTILECLSAVKYAEARGFDSIWQAELTFVRDPFVTMALYAGATRRIGLGVGVVHQPARSLSSLCAQLMTLDDIAPGRVMCALGPWSDQEASKLGLVRPKPLLAMREALMALTRLLGLERVMMAGETLQVLDVRMEPVERPEPRSIPFLLGGTGAFHALAGEIAAGMMLNSMVTPDYTAYAVGEARVGLQKARRAEDGFQVAQLILCSVQGPRESETAAFQRAQRAVLQAIFQKPEWMRANGFSQEVISECLQWAGSGGDSLEPAYQLLTPALVRQVVAFGTDEEVRARVRDYVNAGATLPVIVPLGTDVRPLVDAFSQGYRAPFLADLEAGNL